MKKTFTLLAAAAMLSSSAFAVTVNDVLSDFEARGWDTSLNDGMGDWSEDVAPNRFTFLYETGVDLSTSATAKVSLYCGEELLASIGTGSTVIDLFWGEFAIDLFEVQSKKSGEYSLVIDDDFLTFNGEPVTGGSYQFTFEGADVPSTDIVSVNDVLSSFDARGWDSSLSDGFGDWSDAIAPNRFTFLVKDGADLSTSTSAKVSLYYGDELLASAGTSSLDIDFWLGEFSIDFYKTVQSKKDGEYSLVIDDDFLTYNGQPLKGYTYSFTFEGGGDEPGPGPSDVDFTYVLNPEAGASVEKPNQIVLTFTAATEVSYNMIGDAVASLKNENGSIDFVSYWPDIEDNSLIFSFGNEETAWPAGEYTFTVYPNMVAVDMSGRDLTAPGNFEGLEVKYTVAGFTPAPRPELADYMTLTFPSSLECNNKNTATEENPDGGMSLIRFTVKGDIKPAPAEEWPDYILMIYSNGEEGNYFSFNPNDPESFEIVPISGEGEDLVSEWILRANTDESWGFSLATYQKEGTYTLQFPNKTFLLNGEPMEGTEFVFEYTIDPTAVNMIEVAESYVVYTIDGRVAYIGADRAAINGLDAGLYIINGKKVLLTK
ncbi:MAG: hypothetical protein K2M03_04740 [Muribaculaceae bacterium]|nr:hypothetical protein [Muribaculaceae bacterium]